MLESPERSEGRVDDAGNPDVGLEIRLTGQPVAANRFELFNEFKHTLTKIELVCIFLRSGLFLILD